MSTAASFVEHASLTRARSLAATLRFCRRRLVVTELGAACYWNVLIDFELRRYSANIIVFAHGACTEMFVFIHVS